MPKRARASLLGIVLLASAVAPATAQRAGSQDTTRRPTVDEYQAMRRAWLEARRTGALGAVPPAYGSAIVGSGMDLRAGVRAGGVIPCGPGWPGWAGDPWPMRGGDPRDARGGQRGSGDTRGDPDRGRRDRGSRGENTGGAGAGRGGFDSDIWDFGNDCWSGYRWGWPYAGPTRGPFSPGYPGYGFGPGSGFGQHGFGLGPQGYGFGPPAHGYGPDGYGFGYKGIFGYQGGFGTYGPGVPYGGSWSFGPWSGFGGASEYGLGPWGYSPLYPFGWGTADGGYRFPWPGIAGGECAEVTVTAGGGLRYSIRVAPQTFGLTRLSDLDLAIDARLSSGQPVLLYGIDGRMLRLDPGPGVEDVRVRPCESR